MPKNPSAEDMARFTKYGKKEGVDPQLLASIAYQESRFRNKAVSPTKARGMFQFMPPTAKDYGVTDVNDLHDPEVSTRIAAKHVAKLQKRYPDDPWKVLAAYNTGQGNVDRYGKGVLGPNWNKRKNAGETGRYVKKITADYKRRTSGNKRNAELEATEGFEDDFLATSRSLGLRHGLKKEEAKKAPAEKAPARGGSGKRAQKSKKVDRVASPEEAASMQRQAAARNLARQAKDRAGKLYSKKFETLMEQARYQSGYGGFDEKTKSFIPGGNQGNASYPAAHIMAKIKDIMGPEQDKEFRALSNTFKNIALFNQAKVGSAEKKEYEGKARKEVEWVIKNSAIAASFLIGGPRVLKYAQKGVQKAVEAGVDKAFGSLAKEGARASRIARRPSPRMHGPAKPPSAKTKALENTKPPRDAPRQGTTGQKAREENYLLDKYGPPRGPSKLKPSDKPPSRHPRQGVSPKRAAEEKELLDRLGRPSGPAKAPVDRQIAQGTTRFAGPSTLKKPKLLRAKGEKPGEALSRMQDEGRSWKDISEASGLTQGQARSAVRRFRGTHTPVQKQLGLTGKPTTKLADFLRSRVTSKAEFKTEYKRLIKELVELGMPQRARELAGLR